MRKYLIPVLVVLLLVFSACKEVAVEERDKKVFLRAGELAAYGFDYERPEKYESFKKTYFYDNTYQIEYEFETPDDEKEKILYLTQSVSVENRESDARLSGGSEEAGINLGLRIGGVESEKKDDFYSYGDGSSFYVLKKDGKPVGNYFTTRLGKKTFSLMIVGLYVSDAEIWRELVEPKLKEFAAYVP